MPRGSASSNSRFRVSGRKSNSRCYVGSSNIIGTLERCFWLLIRSGAHRNSGLRQVHSRFGSIAKARLSTRSTCWIRKRLISPGDEHCFGLDCEKEVVPTAIGIMKPVEPGPSGQRPRLNFTPAATQVTSPKVSFPAVTLLQTTLASLDSDVPLAIVVPPVFFTELPARSNSNADLIAQCKGALEEVTIRRKRGIFLNFEVDGEIARNQRISWMRCITGRP